MQKVRPAEVVAYFTAGGLVCVVFLVVMQVLSSGATAADWLGQNGAAWVQAIGSIAALAITIWLWRHAATEEERRAKTMCDIFCGQLAAAVQDIDRIAREDDIPAMQKRLVRLREVIAYGRLIKLETLPARGTWAMLDLLSHAAQAEHSLTTWTGGMTGHLSLIEAEARSLSRVTDVRIIDVLEELGMLGPLPPHF